MIIDCTYPFIELQMMCREMDAPVYVRRKRRSNQFSFVRRNSATIEDVERFFTSFTNDERIKNDTSTNNQ